MTEAGQRVRAGYTLGQLAEIVGMSPRNIRAYQSRGLLHPPVRVGRGVLYSSSHAARLQLVMALQRENLSLNAIVKVLEDPARWGGVLPVMSSGTDPTDGWVVVERESVELLRAADASAFAALEAAGLLVAAGEDRLCHPTLSVTGAALYEHGLDPVLLTRIQAQTVAAAAALVPKIVGLTRGVDEAAAAEVRALLQRLLTTGFEISLKHLTGPEPASAERPGPQPAVSMSGSAPTAT